MTRLVWGLSCVLVAGAALAGNNFTDNPDQAIWKFSPDLDVPHLAWAKPLAGKPVRATVIAPRISYRDVVELCQRCSLEVNRVMTSSYIEAASSSHFDQYPNQGEKPEVWLDLIRGEVQKETDVVVVGKFRWTALPADVRQALVAKVQAGVGLLYINPELTKADDGSLGLLLATGEVPKTPDPKAPPPAGMRVPLKLVDVAHPAVRLLTGLRLPQLTGKEWTDLVYAGELGKGRVLAVNFPYQFGLVGANEDAGRQAVFGGAQDHVKHSLVGAARATELPCAYEYLMSFVAKAVCWCAGRAPAARLEGLNVQEGKPIQVTTTGTAATHRVTLEVRDTTGDLGAQLKAWEQVTGPVALPRLSGGAYFVNAWLKDAEGRILDWGTVRLDVGVAVPEPSLKEILLDVSAPPAGAPVVGAVRLALPWPAGDRLRLSAVDNFGRCLWQREFAPATVSVPFQAEFDPGRSIAVRLTAERWRGEQSMERLERTVCFARRDLDGDYSFIVWSDFSYDDRVMRQDLETCRRLGVDAVMHAAPTMREAVVRANVRLAHYMLRVTSVQVRGFSQLGTLEWWEGFCRRSGQELARFAPLTMTFGDETSYGWPDDGTAVTSWLTQPYSDQTFRLFLAWYFDPQNGNLNLARLNQAWGTAFKSADEIKVQDVNALRQSKARAQWVCEALWADWQFQRLLRTAAEAARTEVPWAYFGDEGVGSMYSGDGHDYYLVQQDMDICQLYDYQSGPFLVKSFGRRDGLRGMWTGNYGYFNGEVDDEWMRSFAWRSLFYGMNSAWWWMTPLAIYCDRRPIPCFAGLAEEVQRIKSGPATLLLKAARPAAPQVAVLYSPNTIHVNTFDTSKAGPHRYALTVACQGLISAGYAFQVLHPSQLDTPAVLAAGYRALVLPAVTALSDAQVATIRDFVKNGGLLLADRVPDQYFNELGLPRAEDPFRALFKPGAQPGEFTHGQGRAVLLKEPLGLSAVERYKDVLGQSWAEQHQQTLAGMLRGFIEGQIGVKPPVTVRQADGKLLSDAEISPFTDGPALYLGIDRNGRYWEGEQLKWLRWPDYREEIKAKLEFPAASYVYDVGSGQYLGHGTSIEVTLTSYPRLFAALPSKVAAVQLLELAKGYAQGEAIRGRLVVKGGPEAGFSSVVHLALKDAKGTRLPWAERNVTIFAGEGAFVLPLALDEAPGDYDLEARDVASGTLATARFRVVARVGR